jgi:hypothetical protein
MRWNLFAENSQSHGTKSIYRVAAITIVGAVFILICFSLAFSSSPAIEIGDLFNSLLYPTLIYLFLPFFVALCIASIPRIGRLLGLSLSALWWLVLSAFLYWNIQILLVGDMALFGMIITVPALILWTSLYWLIPYVHSGRFGSDHTQIQAKKVISYALGVVFILGILLIVGIL